MLRSFRSSRIVSIFAIALTAALGAQSAVYADVPYQTYYKDNFNQQVLTQPAYIPADAFGREIYVSDSQTPGGKVYSPLKTPQDLFVDKQDHIYIADTGNSRIVHLDEAGQLVRILEVKESPLKRPEGLYVDDSGNIYVADTGNKRVVLLDSEGRLVREFLRPDSKFLPESFKYDPVKLVVDKRGFLYIATMGGYQGLLKLDQKGGFLSFFGANQTEVSFADMLKRLLYTSEMYQREISKRPGTVTGVTSDQNGFIYTVSQSVKTGQVKKLNIAGLDLLAGKGEYSESGQSKSFGERDANTADYHVPQKLTDLTVDHAGNITVIDGSQKIISQYDNSGNLLFYWGSDAGAAVSNKLGVMRTPTAIAHNSRDELLILDGENNLVQVYRQSEFGALVHKANRLTQEGRYEESEEPWREVFLQNAYYTPALLGLAKAAYKKEDYQTAETLYKLGGHTRGYSESFWQLRLIWFQKNFGKLMNALLAAAIAVYAFRRIIRIRRRQREPGLTRVLLQSRWAVSLRHALDLIRHPIDGFGALRYEGKASVTGSVILFALAIVSYTIVQEYTSFAFRPSVVLDVNLIQLLLPFVLVWFGWVVSNYLISSINQGEGRFRDIVHGSVYSLLPFVIIGLPLTLVSNMLTLNESAIYAFLEMSMYGWTGLLVIWKVQAIHNYGFGEMAANIAMSLLTMAACAVIAGILIGLSTELYDFFYSVYQEVTIR